MFDPGRDYAVELMQNKVTWLNDEALRQLRTGNADTAFHFAVVAHEAQKIIFDISAMILVNQEFSISDMEKYLLSLQ